MTTIFVNWGQSRVMLTWKASTQLPKRGKITSVHGFCFYEDKLVLVDLKHRGWDIPGGHINLGEEPELIDSKLVSQYHHEWNSLYQEILDICIELPVK